MGAACIASAGAGFATAPPRRFMGTTDDRIAAAPLPTTRTLRRRSSIPRQIWPFGQINLRMLRIVRKAH